MCVGVAVVPLTWREFDKFIISHRIWFGGCVRFASRRKVRRPSCGDGLARTPGIVPCVRGDVRGMKVRVVFAFGREHTLVPGW